MGRVNKPLVLTTFEVGKGRVEKSNILLRSLLMPHTIQETESCLKHPTCQTESFAWSCNHTGNTTEELQGAAGIQEGSRWGVPGDLKTNLYSSNGE